MKKIADLVIKGQFYITNITEIENWSFEVIGIFHIVNAISLKKKVEA